jgi:hypothetical protein
MSFFKSAVQKMRPTTAPAPQSRKPMGGFVGARQAPQAAQAPQAVVPQKPGNIWDRLRKK